MENIERPQVTLTYAQSLDGSIAARAGQPLTLSGTESLQYTHQLRATHDAILVGIGTVLSDDPRLDVRLAEGPSPRPIVLDSSLRCPLMARCLDPGRRPLVAAADQASDVRRRDLEAQGVTVISIPCGPADNSHIDLAALLGRLAVENIRSVMVEGGARVITSFLRARLVDRLIITITPVLVGGAHGVLDLLADEAGEFPRLQRATWQPLGHDWVVAGIPDWGRGS